MHYWDCKVICIAYRVVHPAIEGEMSSFFICGKAWGIYSQKEENGKMCKHIDILYGTLDDIHVQE